MDSSYTYKRLDLATDAIRLVRIFKGRALQPIECEIFETYLNQVEGVPYEALSYVWGNKEARDKIRVDGCLFPVTENLFEALSNLRLPREDRLLWVDAMCIDQSHNAERSHQVGQMHSIYSNAHRIIIWLGASTKEIDCLFYWMLCLDHQMRMLEHQHTINIWKHQWNLLGPQIESQSDRLREGLQDLLRREWFSRIWVVQEAALARRATITCGHNNISSQTFVVMPTLIDISCNDNVQARLEIMPGLLRRNSWWSGPEFQDLDILLKKFGKSKAKDPRDIVYALLGLSKDTYTSDILRPNYEISLQETIQHTIAYLLVQSGYANHCSAYKDMPFWNMGQFMSALDDLPSIVGERTFTYGFWTEVGQSYLRKLKDTTSRDRASRLFPSFLEMEQLRRERGAAMGAQAKMILQRLADEEKMYREKISRANYPRASTLRRYSQRDLDP